MGDLISRDYLLERIDKCVGIDGIGLEPVMAIRDIKALISVMPTVEAEPVIHCKDCQHYYYADNRIPSQRAWVCGITGVATTDDSYCADADRREE